MRTGTSFGRRRVRFATAGLVAAALVAAACGGGSGSGATDADAATGEGSAPPPAARGGEPEPTAEMETWDGRMATIAELRGGKPGVVNFWASWCPPCIGEMPEFEEVHQALGDEVVFIGVNTQDEPEKAAQFAEQTGVTYLLTRDPQGEWARTFGVIGMPSTYFITADGRIVEDHAGALTKASLEEMINELLLS